MSITNYAWPGAIQPEGGWAGAIQPDDNLHYSGHFYKNRTGPLNYSNLVNKAHPLNRGLVSWWLTLPTRRGNIWHDLKGKNHGTLTNGPTWQGSKGRPGGWGSLQFDGTDSYLIASNVKTISLPITVSGWFRVDSGSNSLLVSHHTPATNNGWRVSAVNFGTAGTLRFTLGGVADYGFSGSSNPMFIGRWNFFAVTVTGNGGTAKAYWTVEPGGPLYSPATLAVGTMSGSPTEIRLGITQGGLTPLNGPADSIKVHNRVLSSSEIQELYTESRRSYPNLLNRSSNIVYSFSEPAKSPYIITTPRPAKTGPLKYSDLVNKSHPLNRDLVSWWLTLPTRRGNTWRDLMNKNHGTLTNNPTWCGSSNRLGGWGSLTLNGTNNYVSVGDKASLEFSAGSSLFFSFWINISSSADISQHPMIIAKADSSPSTWYIVRVWNNGKIVLDIKDGSANRVEFGSAVGANPAINDGKWHFVTTGINSNNDTAYIFINGVQKATTSAASIVGTLGVNDNPLFIGADSTGGAAARFLPGRLDDIRIYNRALSATEIKQLYNESRKGYFNLLNRFSNSISTFSNIPSDVVVEEPGGGTVHTGVSSVQLVINQLLNAARIAAIGGSYTLQINNTNVASLLGAGETTVEPAQLVINETTNAVRIRKVESSNTIVINNIDQANSIFSGQSSETLQINSAQDIRKLAGGLSNTSLQINNTSDGSRKRYGSSQNTLVINSNLANFARIAAASLLDTLQIISGVTGRIVGEEGQVHFGQSSNTLQIDASIAAMLTKRVSVNSQLEINTSLSGSKIMYGDSDVTLQLGTIPVASKITNLSSLMNLEIDSLFTPGKIIFPQLNTTLQISNPVTNVIRGLFGDISTNLKLINTSSGARLRGVNLAPTCEISSSFNINVVWNGSVVSIPVKIIAVVDASEVAQDLYYIMFDAEIIRELGIFDVRI